MNMINLVYEVSSHGFLRLYSYSPLRDPLALLERMLIPTLYSGSDVERVYWAKTAAWRRANDLIRYLPDTQRDDVVGISDELVVHFAPRDASPTETLVALDRKAKLPEMVAHCLLKSSHTPRYAEPEVIAAFYSGLPRKADPFLTSRTVKQEATKWIAHLLTGQEGIPVPDNTVDRARLFRRVGIELWEPDVAARVVKLTLQYAETGDLNPMMYVASAVAEMGRHQTIEVAGHPLEPNYDDPMWLAFVELQRRDHPITVSVLRWLTGQVMPSVTETFIPNTATLELDPDAPRTDAEQANLWVSALMRRATEQAIYTPTGQFYLRFPSDFPLRGWGVGGLRVAADEDGMWVSLNPNGGESVFRWNASTPTTVNPFVVPWEVAPLVWVTLSALWYDLVREGEEAIIEISGAKRSRRSTRGGGPRQDSERVRRLPRRRKRYVRIDGEREWGSSDEQTAASQRAASPVSWAYRRVGKEFRADEAAFARAAKEGVYIIPDEHTFVRSHWRGLDGNDEPSAVEVRPRVVAEGLFIAGEFVQRYSVEGGRG